MDELIRLAEPDAARAYFDGRNCRVLFRFLTFFTVTSALTALVLVAEKRYALLPLPLANLIVVRGLRWASFRTLFTAHFRWFLIGYLVFQAALIVGLYFEPRQVHPLDFFLPWLVISFRLPFSLLLVPLAAVWSLTAGRNLLATTLATDLEPHLGLVLGQTAISLLVLGLTQHFSRRSYRQFRETWRRDNHRWQEQLRMREELDDARRIQLSMLPRTDPSLPWLDIAGISVPASEVGGDYYDYFKHSDERLAVVVADVAGHGVASGLLLAGVRSCLYLLEENPHEPTEVLTKLDRMLRGTTGPRVFVTFLYAVFERDRRSLTFAVAAHPPLLHYRARSGEVEEHRRDALPLGTALGHSSQQSTIAFEPGDIFLFYTDGISETTSSSGELYGYQRLRERLEKTPRERSAREIRDTLIGNVWAFKGDGVQTDDITLVVVRIR